jgi:hypothetical protein
MTVIRDRIGIMISCVIKDLMVPRIKLLQDKINET